MISLSSPYPNHGIDLCSKIISTDKFLACESTNCEVFGEKSVERLANETGKVANGNIILQYGASWNIGEFF